MIEILEIFLHEEKIKRYFTKPIKEEVVYELQMFV